MHLQENSLFDTWPWGHVTWNVAKFRLHCLTYPCTKFEVAKSNRLGGDTFTRNVTARRTDRQTMDLLWYKINIPFFSKEKSGYKYIEF